MKSLVERFLKIRIIRYGLVGGIGIPIQDLAFRTYDYTNRVFYRGGGGTCA